jgi:hypothetical protein
MRTRTWTRRGIGAAILLSAAAAIVVVPAWGEDGGTPEPTVATDESTQPDPLRDCLLRHGAPIGERPTDAPPADELPPPPDFDDAAFAAAAEACGMTDPPPGTDPFPLSDDQIAAWTQRLDEYVACMRDHGQNLGDPDIERDRIAIELDPGAFSEEFLAAERDCGGPPV